MVGATKLFVQLPSPFDAELTEHQENLKMATALQYRQVVFETDFLMLVHAINQCSTDCLTLGLIDDVKISNAGSP